VYAFTTSNYLIGFSSFAVDEQNVADSVGKAASKAQPQKGSVNADP